MSIGTKIINSAVILGISNIVLRFISFFTIIFVVRALSVTEYGLFTLFMSLTGPATVLSDMGMGELILADVARNLGEKNLVRAKSIMWHFFRLRLVLLLLILILGFIFKGWLEVKYGNIIVGYFWLFVFLILSQYFRNIYAIIFQIHERFKVFSVIGILESGIKFIAVLLFYFFWKLNMATLIIAYICGTFGSVLIFTPQFLSVIKYLKKVPVEKTRLLYQIMRQHGKWQMAQNIINGFTSSIKYWIVKIFISTEAIGLLALAQNLYSALASLTPIKTVTFPIIAKKLKDKFLLEKLIQKISKYSLLIYALMVASVFVVISPLIPYIFPKYLAAIPIFQLLSFRLLFNTFSISQATLLFAYREQKISSVMATISLFSILILSPILMLYFGLIGTVIEALITVAIVACLREIYLRKKYHLKTISWRSLISIDETDRFVIRSIISNIKTKIFRLKS